MALTDKLTAIADAIRGKTGKSDSMTLDQMPTEIAGIQAGGGGVTVESANVYEITIGANSITNAFDANAYIFGLVHAPAYVLLNSVPDTYNQLVGFGFQDGEKMLRYRNGAIGPAVNQTAYDGVLVEGTVYTVFEYGV